MLNHPLAKWNKSILALIGLLCNVAYAYNASNPNDLVAALLVVATVLGVFQVKNKK